MSAYKSADCDSVKQNRQSILNKIKQWIKKYDLNEYGDPKGTAYMGGTPLFNERT